MPFFDFKCEKCGHQFNKRVSNEDKAAVKCEKCGHSRVIQMLSPFYSSSPKTSSAGNPGLPGGCAGCSHFGSGCGM
ncbi:MAG: zinc ribbon domain-containing protein [Syntrophomonadaceae bacterium]|nr:zinc ribbon domain-containing protein [Syntrophomonadaceae bacterium]